MNKYHDIGVARQIGSYSDAVEVPQNARWLFTAGTPAIRQSSSIRATRSLVVIERIASCHIPILPPSRTRFVSLKNPAVLRESLIR